MADLSPETRDAVREGVKRSAAVVLPLVFAELGTPAYLLDVGAGEAHWGKAAEDLGVQEAIAVDLAGGWLDATWDAESGDPLPLPRDIFPLWGGDGTWPLALCLEMAEHVSPAAGDHLVAELTRVADAVLWSAALPYQTGDGHVNLQYPSYWQERFETHGWTLTDPFRVSIWTDERIEVWYRANLLLAMPGVGNPPLDLVHPEIHGWNR